MYVAHLRRQTLTIRPIIRRVCNYFLDFRSNRLATFSVTRLPQDVCWGPQTPVDDLSHVLCWYGRPIVIWVVGYVRSLTFSVNAEDCLPRIGIAIELCRDDSVSALAVLLRKFTNGEGEYQSWDSATLR